MEPFLKRVEARLKASGLPVAETLVQQLSDAVFAEAIVEIQGNDQVWDNFLEAPIVAAQGIINKMIAGIDGK